MANQEAYERAKERAESKLLFYRHLSVYLAVSVLLVIINLSASPGYLWVQWPLLGWGIAVLLHALSVFVFHGRSPVVEQMIQKELRKES